MVPAGSADTPWATMSFNTLFVEVMAT